MSKKLYGIVARVMDISISEINDNSSPETIPSWDSFNSYILLDELESEFKTEFTIDEVTETKNVSDIKKNLKIHGINLDD
ncbi:MAG: acyl carrier protein [Thaumarchaeota archaeon]|jgi:acyl carrier protein|nr:MAG: acyl carrier protein [Nitrososphaerota archaeon]